MKKLPIGIQSFEDLRKNDYLYVDKTAHIYRIVTTGKAYFLSRPRRFGKSLLISTMDALFTGRKELFEGLYIYDKWDWTQPSPVIRIDFGRLDFRTTEELSRSLRVFIQKATDQYQLSLPDAPLSQSFGELIEQLHKSTGQQAVVLIDEYDKPITDHLSNPEVMKTNKETLHSFYQVLKAADEHIRFVFLTGVSKFSGVSVFSALNSLEDITLDDPYASICGYTQEELESNFTEYIDVVAQKLSMSREALLDEIRIWYNGYSWDGETPVYNPFSTLSFFKKERFVDYWFRTGTPTFLIELLKSRNQLQPVLEPIIADESAFDSYDSAGIDGMDATSLLFQTGYLTIKQRTLKHGIAQYTLDLPNSEVKNAFLKHLLNVYCAYPIGKMTVLISEMQQQVRDKDTAGLEQNLRMLFAHIPYELHVKNEAYYNTMFLLLMRMLDFDIHGQIQTNIGRIDAVWHQPELTVVAEIKYHADKSTDGLPDEAMTQIRDRRYYEMYLDRKVLLLGVAFTGKDLGCRIEEIKK